MLGISTSFFAFHGLDIYSSVSRARELGFKTVELGAAHKFEKDIFQALKKVKNDFGDLEFTLHGFFPPQPTPFWFNPCEGLSPRNKKLLDEMFKAAELMEARVASIHTGAFDRLGYDAGNVVNGMIWEVVQGQIDQAKAMDDFKELIGFALAQAGERSLSFAIENVPSTVVKPALLSAQDFREFFEDFPSLSLLLDVGHALVENRLPEFLELKEKIVELHLHDAVGETDHIPLGEGELDLSLLKRIPGLKNLPLVMEYGGRTSEKEMLAAKEVAEAFLSTL